MYFSMAIRAKEYALLRHYWCEYCNTPGRNRTFVSEIRSLATGSTGKGSTELLAKLVVLLVKIAQ